MVFSLDVRAHSEVGLVRKNNQDSAYASPTMLLVADGMGGAAAGDLASTVAVREMLRADASHTIEDAPGVLAGALHRANDLLADLVKADPTLDGMGTTVCGALFTGSALGLVHIGDSRGYLARTGRLHRLTHDHSWVQSLVDEGKISLDEAAVHPHRSLLLKVLNGQTSNDPDTDRVELALDDRLLFCSDGLCGFVPDAVIKDILTGTPDLDEAMAKLVAAAHRGGGADNITVVLADVVPHDDALDAVAPLLVGAAADAEVPEIEENTLVGIEGLPLGDLKPEPAASDERVLEGPDLAVLDEQEARRYAPKEGRMRPVLAGLAVTTALLLLAGAGLWGAWQWSRTQYFVGEEQQQVAIFRGIPGSLLGRDLGEVAERSEVRVDDLPTFYRQQVRTTIPVSGLEAARSTVGELRSRAEACRKRRQQAGPRAASPTPLSSAGPSAAPSPSASASAGGIDLGGC